MTDHRTTYIPTCTGKKFTPVCSCGWWGEEWGDEKSAREQADMHERGKRQAWEAKAGTVWTPGERPFDGT